MKRKSVFSTLALLGFLLPWFGIFDVSAAHSDDSVRMPVGLSDNYSARVGFVPPANDGAPRRSQSGASRRREPDACGGLPLLPESGLGLTMVGRPSLYTYFSKGSAVNRVMLTVKSLDESEEYETFVNLPVDKFSQSGGVLEIETSAMMPDLKTGEEYEWSMILMCNGDLRPRPDSPSLQGAVRRVESVLGAQSNDVSLADQAKIYGDAGVWYDLLATLAMIRVENPNDTQSVERWSSSLRMVGLDAIADAPLIMQ